MADGITVNVTPRSPAAERVELASRAIMLAYSAFMAWQMAKMVVPGLEVKEKALIERVARRFRKRDLTQRQADDFVAQVTQYVRSK